MEIKTNHRIGQQIWIIRDSKATPIEIKLICIDESGVRYGDNRYNLYPEHECFISKQALLAYVAEE